MRLVIKVIKFVRFLFGLLLHPLILTCYKIYFSKWDKTKPLRPANDPLLFLSATELAKRLRNREVCLFNKYFWNFFMFCL